jgi:hypothetical protein
MRIMNSGYLHLRTFGDRGDLSWCQLVSNFVEPLRVRKGLVKFRTVAL